jgi:predicted kinase
MGGKAKLLFLCGKMAAGKSTLSRELAERENAVLFVQDEFLERLFPGEIVDIPGYVKYSSRLHNALEPHICSLLSGGISVVLDFPGNTRSQRAWFRHLLDASGAAHELHFIDASDDVCKRQLRGASCSLPVLRNGVHRNDDLHSFGVTTPPSRVIRSVGPQRRDVSVTLSTAIVRQPSRPRRRTISSAATTSTSPGERN